MNTGLPKIDQVKSKLNNQTCAILITHLYSSKKNIQKFIKTFKNQTIIEDTAINFGAKVNNNYLGTLANYGFFSFGTMKNLCLFNGGLIYCKREKDLKKIKKLEEKFHNYPYFEFVKKVLLAAIIDFAYNKYIYAFFTNLVLKFIYKNKIYYIIKIIYPGLFPRQHKYIPKIISINIKTCFTNCINFLKNTKQII